MSQFNEGAAGQAEVEQAHVAATYRLLDERLAEVRAQLTDVLRSPADSAGEVYARDVAAERLARQLRQLEGAGEGLAFGRVDGADGTALHIGRLGLHVGDQDLPLLVDWRADAVRPFYEATAVHPMGLRRRCHLRVEGRAVRAVGDELLDGSSAALGDVVGDGPLTEALEARCTGRMRAAVATLQVEQDAIVRSPHRGVTVVQGGPGTGKPVVALHRAAYVLYAFPGAAARGVLVLWPRLTPEAVVRALLADARTLAKHLPSLPGGERSRLVRSHEAPWTDADVPLLDEAAASVNGLPERSFGHVVVDEAQDLTAMQWRMVMRRCPARSMTLVGDFAQAGPATAVSDWSQALGPHVGSRFALHTLTVSYRTTQEILETTHRLLARIAPGRTPSRSIRLGDPPRHIARPSGERDLYVALTRATKRLCTIAVYTASQYTS